MWFKLCIPNEVGGKFDILRNPDIIYNELIMINKTTPCEIQNYWLKTFDTQVNEPTNQNSIKVSKVFKQT